MNSHDTAVVTCVFSAAPGSARAKNLEAFLDALDRQAVPVFVAELAYDDMPFLLPKSACVLQLRTEYHSWHKERLLNLAVQSLDRAYEKIVWADCDIIFERPDWLVETSRLLDEVAVMQPFDMAVRVAEEGQVQTDPEMSFAASFVSGRSDLNGGMSAHGHTGFAWAARRSLFEGPGLLDICLSGTGDHLMAHGFVGDMTSHCVSRLLVGAPGYEKAYRRWCHAVADLTGARISAIEGTIRHLPHPTGGGHSYLRRNFDLLRIGYDPDRDLAPSDDGLLHLLHRTPDHEAWQARHFPNNEVRAT
ncbi:hypothetical protein ABVF61_01535 [Roseibium sp. HPY-6]|uniref:hypothetical protein n=1 Tax=Roseibium sp. HPY-6 TaxID=3229852 RepID=UPI00338E7943